VVKKQASRQGETTHNKDDKHPHRKKVQIVKSNRSFVRKPKRIGAVAAKKHITLFTIRERRKGVRNQVTIDEFVYKRSNAREGSPLYGKWYKLHKGESVEEAIHTRGKEAVIVDSPPVQEDLNENV
jgi:hypothetical protein